ncbi:PhzF family phenazine biosynthesis isomerase [Gordonia amarae]|uniref:PhzF family phenazine biosynthesis isomerase n=2 Tax=Gordonia amarae TaxID=36821 RepID=A0A857LMR6_9ACTN|nr:PhzF family phenazine biosynthesis protein [Gordonia amarae]MCS3878046.1 PhzF family phenazine biosynthesis protein [Gordonia amarae]QHN16741.1 PhzF family phenazine biosynthesis isomerase [Gordonia amarae]QHN21266.1 PhzF family phenazine biosynthesis isomerase [Gordonia amarae]QHN30120.1 PhzF family phenazine biosynthesis isomerase [Gordonia amarae]QHN38893.1 PhzF family phenazine biosynthesis isomerase [Gordonia amarae]
MTRRFAQLDVFSPQPTRGNPLAVVVDADGLDDGQLAAFARWTNLSETTFLLPPAHPDADYRVRIFTPGGELPFAGHPTLGSAHAWLATGGVPKAERIVQECGVGLVPIRRDGERLAFAAPPLIRTGSVDQAVVAEVAAALGLDSTEISAAEWVVNGPDWMLLVLDSGERVLSLQPDMAALGTHKVGVVGPYPSGSPISYEVRAFAPGVGVPEDPVTGSLNAGVAMWMRAAGRVPPEYVAAQGAAIGRAGRVYITDDGTDIWVGGDCVTVIEGTVAL